MSLRKNLVEIIDLIDSRPEVETDSFSKAVDSALKTFKKNFNAELKAIDAEKIFDDLKSRLIQTRPELLSSKVKELTAKNLTGLCKYLKIDAKLKSQKIIALENKISDIRKQTY